MVSERSLLIKDLSIALLSFLKIPFFEVKARRVNLFFSIGPYQNRTDIDSVKRNCTNRYTKRPLFILNKLIILLLYF